MIREAIDKIIELAPPILREAFGLDYYHNRRSGEYLPIRPPQPDPIETHTLSSIVDYLKEQVDYSTERERVNGTIIHVIYPDAVRLVSPLNVVENRHTYVSATCENDRFQYGRYIDVEQFIIDLQACFVPNGTTESILQIVGTLKDENIRTLNDDGITQRVTASTGVASVGNVNVPNPVNLMPYRTFPEIEQPESRFVLRLKSQGGQVFAGLWPADGDGWKLDAILAIKEWFECRDLPEEVSILA